jgi:acetyltransferase-like isoleucine patch superfamily enzyme
MLAPQKKTWDRIQDRFADIPGDLGIALRRRKYAPFFMRIGGDVVIEEGCRFFFPERIALDDGAVLEASVTVSGSSGVMIGRRVRIGKHASIGQDEASQSHGRGQQPQASMGIRIGDCCTIGIGSRLHEGVHLQSGCVVADGTVLQTGDRQEPGKRASTGLDATPIVLLVVPESDAGPWLESGKLLLSALGLPQVGIQRAGEAIPPTVKAIVFLGPDGWKPGIPAGIPGWMLVPGSHPFTDQVYTGNKLPLESTRVSVLQHDQRRDILLNASDLTCYYAYKRMTKQEGWLDRRESCKWAIVARLIKDGAIRADAGSLNCIVVALSRRLRPRRWWTLNSPESFEEAGSIDDICRLFLSGIIAFGESDRDQTALDCNKDGLYGFCRVISGQGDHDLLLEKWHDVIMGTDDPRIESIAGFGLAALCRGNRQAIDQGIALICAEKHLDRTTGCIKSSSSGYSTDPLLAAMLGFSASRRDHDYVARLFTTRSERLIWSGLTPPAAVRSRSSSGLKSALVDSESQHISRSLWDNWLKLASVPDLGSRQIEIGKHSYLENPKPVEDVWRGIFSDFIRAAGEPVIRLKPWPYPYQAAMSIRYDIDREPQPEQISAIMEIQRSQMNAACATWYFIPGKTFNERVRLEVMRFPQEAGIHRRTPADPVPGAGITCHSAQDSNYWRGEESVVDAERVGARYAEMLASQFSWPRHGWIERDGGRATVIPLTPLHFPLEGSTKDVSLSYFDLLLDEFRSLRKNGGHLIVASHPDLNQNLLISLLRRERLDGLWCCTIGQAVERTTRVLDHGSVAAVKNGHWTLVSKGDIADLQAEIDDGAKASRVRMQLKAGEPNRVPGL